MTISQPGWRMLAGVLWGAVCVTCFALPADGQERYRVYPYRRYYGNYYGAVDALASRVFARAELLRASGEASVNYAAAREIHARARRLEIANAVERVKAYWEVRSIGEAERFKRRFNPLDSRRLRNSKTWDRLKNHPDLNGPAIAGGRALNFLLHRLSSSVLAYEYSRDYNSSGDALAGQLALTPEILNGLRLRRHLPNGQSTIFTADDPAPLQVDWWPFALREEAFDALRADFERERKQVVKEAGEGEIRHESLQELSQAFMNLSDEFHEYYDKNRRHQGGFQSWQQYKQADDFLKSLWGEIGRAQAVHDVDFLGKDLQFQAARDGGNLVALLRFMSRNGLDFAPSRPGDERSYHVAFGMMRDLYINVADDDEALQPQTEKYQKRLR